MTFTPHFDSHFPLKMFILQNDYKWEKMNGKSEILSLKVEIFFHSQAWVRALEHENFFDIVCMWLR